MGKEEEEERDIYGFGFSAVVKVVASYNYPLTWESKESKVLKKM